LVVFGVLAWVLTRFRATPGAPLPAQTRGHTLLEIAWTIAPALVLLGISVPTLHVIFRTQAAPPAQALEVTVLGRQWWWEFRYPTLNIATANRRMRVIVDAPDAFERWAAAQRVTPAPPTGLAAQGKAIFASGACVACHTIRGVSAGVLGPDLTTFGSRRTLAAGMFPNTPE